MELAGSDTSEVNEEVQVLSGLTNYPPSVIKDVLQADRMYVLDRVCDDMHEVGTLPNRYAFKIPGYGTIRLTRLSGGRTVDAKWEFIPTDGFRDGFFNSFYYGISPVFQRMRMNFDELMDAHKRNLLRGGDDG